ncbi:MAG: hypothetical protein F4Y26_14700 [Gammaproteobacteria bacterium]|nr:hypothetical protein [Gammaproteobacteria bacterium]
MNPHLASANSRLAGGGPLDEEAMMAILKAFTETARALNDNQDAWQEFARAMLAYAECAERG